MNAILWFLVIAVIILFVAALAVYLVVRKLPIEGTAKTFIEVAVWGIAIILIIMRLPI